MSMWEHSSFKRMISSKIFAAIAWLLVWARWEPGSSSLFSGFLSHILLILK